MFEAERTVAEESELRNWASVLHFSLLAGYVIPMAGIIAPIVIWQIKKAEMPEIDAHGKNAVNFMLSLLIYAVGMVLVVLLTLGLGILVILLPAIALAICSIVFPIIAGIKASNGEIWPYPLSIQFLR